jgi:hypothetical protein
MSGEPTCATSHSYAGDKALRIVFSWEGWFVVVIGRSFCLIDQAFKSIAEFIFKIEAACKN